MAGGFVNISATWKVSVILYTILIIKKLILRRKYNFKMNYKKAVQILKDDAVKMLHSISQQICKNSAVATGLDKVSFHSNPK